jgi:hypothetical protein
MTSLGIGPLGSDQLGPLHILSSWAVSVRAFKRNKIPVVTKVLAAALCNSGYSYRTVARELGGLSYIAVRDAYFALVTSLPNEEKRPRIGVAIDGGDLEVQGRNFHIWLARDIETGEIMSFQASPNASVDDGARFLAGVASQCANRPHLRIGRGANAPRGLVNLDLYFDMEANDSVIARLSRLILRGGPWSPPS